MSSSCFLPHHRPVYKVAFSEVIMENKIKRIFLFSVGVHFIKVKTTLDSLERRAEVRWYL